MWTVTGTLSLLVKGCAHLIVHFVQSSWRKRVAYFLRACTRLVIWWPLNYNIDNTWFLYHFSNQDQSTLKTISLVTGFTFNSALTTAQYIICTPLQQFSMIIHGMKQLGMSLKSMCIPNTCTPIHNWAFSQFCSMQCLINVYSMGTVQLILYYYYYGYTGWPAKNGKNTYDH